MQCAVVIYCIVRACASLSLSAGGSVTTGTPGSGGGGEVAVVNAVVGRGAALGCTVRLEPGEQLDITNKHFLSWFRVRSSPPLLLSCCPFLSSSLLFSSPLLRR